MAFKTRNGFTSPFVLSFRLPHEIRVLKRNEGKQSSFCERNEEWECAAPRQGVCMFYFCLGTMKRSLQVCWALSLSVMAVWQTENPLEHLPGQRLAHLCTPTVLAFQSFFTSWKWVSFRLTIKRKNEPFLRRKEGRKYQLFPEQLKKKMGVLFLDGEGLQSQWAILKKITADILRLSAFLLLKMRRRVFKRGGGHIQRAHARFDL